MLLAVVVPLRAPPWISVSRQSVRPVLVSGHTFRMYDKSSTSLWTCQAPCRRCYQALAEVELWVRAGDHLLDSMGWRDTQ